MNKPLEFGRLQQCTCETVSLTVSLNLILIHSQFTHSLTPKSRDFLAVSTNQMSILSSIILFPFFRL